jgi:hypothetical protein
VPLPEPYQWLHLCPAFFASYQCSWGRWPRSERRLLPADAIHTSGKNVFQEKKNVGGCVL